MSSKIFNAVLEHAFNFLKFAGDIVMVTEQVGLKINLAKTKLMTNLVQSQKVPNVDWEIELVNKYVYLGHEIKISRYNQTCEIKRRISLGWAAYGRLGDIFKSELPISLKQETFDTCVCFGVLSGKINVNENVTE